MELQLTSDKNNIYEIIIKKISEMILFQIESKDLPKKLIQKGFSYEEMRKNFNFFNKEEFKNIELIYEQLQLLIKYDKNESSELKFELIEDDEKIEFKIIIKANYLKYENEIIKILFPQKIDVDMTLIELTSLYKKLKQEKDDEINNLNKKLNEYNDIKKEIDELKNEIDNLKEEHNKELINLNEEYKSEINELKNEIKNIKEEHNKEINELKNDFNKIVNEINIEKNSSNNKIKNLENNISNNSNHIYKLDNKLEKYMIDTNPYLINNEIDIVVDIGKEDINKEIYFLDNYDEKHNHLNELNKTNTKLYINNKELEYKKYFKPLKEGKYNIKLKFNISLTDCSYMFAGCKNITKIDFIFFNTKDITNMEHFFSNCNYIESINLSSFNTKNVTNMSCMFSNCNNLIYLDLSSFNTKNVTNMSWMFYRSYNLNNLDLSSFDTKNVTDMSSMLYGCPDSIYESNKSKFKKFKKEELF